MSPASRDEVDGDPALRLRFLQRKEICRAVSRRCYVARDVSTEWPIPVFHCVVVSALRSSAHVPADRGSRVHDWGQRAIAARPAASCCCNPAFSALFCWETVPEKAGPASGALLNRMGGGAWSPGLDFESWSSPHHRLSSQESRKTRSSSQLCSKRIGVGPSGIDVPELQVWAESFEKGCDVPLYALQYWVYRPVPVPQLKLDAPLRSHAIVPAYVEAAADEEQPMLLLLDFAVMAYVYCVPLGFCMPEVEKVEPTAHRYNDAYA